MNYLTSLIERIFGQYAVIARYLLSGATAFSANILSLYILKEYLGLYYLSATVFAFIIGFSVSFLMMKYVTFQDGSTGEINKQLAAYLGVALLNLLLNSTLVFIFVEKIGLWYILAQAISSITIAISSFFIYKYLIFSKPVLPDPVVGL